MTKVLCFANNKGGSGKSTTAANVGYSMAEAGKKVLLIDCDMQLNLTLAYFPEEQVIEMAKGDKNLFYAVKNGVELSKVITPTPYKNIDFIPASTLLSGIEFELFTKWQREFILQNLLASTVASGKYDYILLDAPPTLGGWTMNILVASDALIVPVEASPWGLFGLANMLEFVGQVKTVSPALTLLGVAVTKVDTRKNYFKQTLEALNAQPECKAFTTYIRLDANVEWSEDASKPVGAYKKNARSAEEYRNLTKEIMKRCR
ncbi:MAG: ParA family protein [Clostridia bacterium]|jgi:chromosome partitioning protein|nr:ParA family protein [Clostridia bacterium]MBQ5801829.1 ParA family protein [Clostridia bacterium]